MVNTVEKTYENLKRLPTCSASSGWVVQDEQFDGDEGWYRVDADQSPDKVFSEIQAIVRQVLAGGVA